MIPFNPSPKKAHELDQYVEEEEEEEEEEEKEEEEDDDGGREMAEDLGGGARSGERCWINFDRDTCFDAPSSMSRSSAEPASVTRQETYKLIHRSNPIMPSFILSSSSSSSSPSMNWTQASLRGGRSDNSFHSMVRRDAGLRPYTEQDSLADSYPASAVVESSTANPLSNMEHGFSLDHDSLHECNDSGFGRSFHQSVCDNIRAMNCNQYLPMFAHQGSPDRLWQQPPSWAKLSQLLKTASLPKQESNNQLQLGKLGNSPPFWNASHVCSTNVTAKKKGSEPGIKRPRVETPSPLPSFKVRKEKLGDRITALQQLVSPFGKTDTASVLQEAIDCIKFLHDQVAALSSPYLNSNRYAMHQSQMQQISDISSECSEEKHDLRSRGLCLVPVTSTYPVASATTPDYLWHPTFGGTSRVN